MKIRMASLNEKQRRAVEHTDGSLLLAGAAGTGKTHVVAMRAAHLVDSGQSRPERILVLCPHLSAARDMDERLEALLGSQQAYQGMLIGDFHGSSVDFLREHFDWWDPVTHQPAHGGAAADFTLCDAPHAREILKELLPGSGVEGRRDELLRQLRATKLRLLEQPVLPGTESPSERLAQAFRRTLVSQRLLDRDDLLLACIRMWESLPDLADVMRRRHRHVLVDDVEDLDELQLRWLKLLVGADPRLFAVGDPDQSLSPDRCHGAEVLLHLARAYPSARRIRLEQNYRSTACLLRASEALLASNERPLEGRVWTEDEEGARLHVLEVRDGSAEAHMLPVLVDRLLGAECSEGNEPLEETPSAEEEPSEEGDSVGDAAPAKRQDPLGLGDVAVLYGDPDRGLPIEQAFRNAGMACRRLREERFWDRPESRDLLAYLSCFANPRDQVSFRRMLNVPRRHLGERTADAIMRHGRKARLAPREALADLVSRGFLPTSALDEGRRFLAFLEDMTSLFATTPLPEAFERLLEESGLARAQERSSNPRQHRETLIEFRKALAAHASLPAPDGLRRFLTEVALTGPREAWRPGQDGVSLMCISRARDLEWPVVILVGADEPDDDEDAPERNPALERRRLHVALSRAREEVWIVHARERLAWGRLKAHHPLPVLAEIPEDCVNFSVPRGLRRFTRSRQKHRQQRLAPGQLTLFPRL